MADAALLVTAGATGVLAVAPYGSNSLISCLGTSLGRISQTASSWQPPWQCSGCRFTNLVHVPTVTADCYLCPRRFQRKIRLSLP